VSESVAMCAVGRYARRHLRLRVRPSDPGNAGTESRRQLNEGSPC
jgi:hypothetical protein